MPTSVLPPPPGDARARVRTLVRPLLRSEAVGATVGLIVILASVLVGAWLKARGVRLVLNFPPMLGFWAPHAGPGTPLSLACLFVVSRLIDHRDLSWLRLLLTGWLVSLAWGMSLALIDGLDDGWVNQLLNPNEYLHDLPRIVSPGAFVAEFSDYIVVGPLCWTTHVSAHPPLATLMFWVLQRIGLGGGFWAGAWCLLAGSTVALSVPIAVRALGADAAARRCVPLLALFPGAVCFISADAVFAAVAAAGTAALAVAGRAALGGRWVRALGWGAIAGLTLGTALFLSYGLILYGLIVIAVAVIQLLRSDRRPRGAWSATWLVATTGVALVAAAHALAGFNWLTGLARLRVRYYQGVAADRPYWYFLFADLGAWLIAASPLLAAAAVASLRRLRDTRDPGWPVAVLAAAGVAAALLADLSGMSKAETERIWLPFGVIALSGLALMPGRIGRLAPLAAGGWAIVVNHLLFTGW